MENLASIVGAITGCISLLGLAYIFGVWRGRVDSSLKMIAELLKNYPPAESWRMIQTVWEIYVVEALHNRPDLAQRGSGFKLLQEGEDLIPENLKTLLEHIPKNPHKDDVATGYLVVQVLGLEPISKLAEEKHLSVQEAIAILSTYLEGISP